MLDPSVRTYNKDYLNCENARSDGRHAIDSPCTFFKPQCPAEFGTLYPMIGKSTQPAHASGNVAG